LPPKKQNNHKQHKKIVQRGLRRGRLVRLFMFSKRLWYILQRVIIKGSQRDHTPRKIKIKNKIAVIPYMTQKSKYVKQNSGGLCGSGTAKAALLRIHL
jgi:L-serine deaminase